MEPQPAVTVIPVSVAFEVAFKAINEDIERLRTKMRAVQMEAGLDPSMNWKIEEGLAIPVTITPEGRVVPFVRPSEVVPDDPLGEEPNNG